MNRTQLLVGAAVSLATFGVLADTYRFILSGDPVAAASANSCAAASSGTALVTGTLSSHAAATSLEARFRSRGESSGIALRSDRQFATIIIVR